MADRSRTSRTRGEGGSQRGRAGSRAAASSARASRAHSTASSRSARSSRSRRASRTSSNGSMFSQSRGSDRMFFPLIIFAGLAVLFAVRLVYLQVAAAPEYTSMAQDARMDVRAIEPRRGTIYDRNGVVLATSVDATTVTANPSQVEDPADAAAQLASVLGGEAKDYLEKLADTKSGYAMIKSKIDVELGKQVKDLGITGIYCQDDSRREYPNGKVGGQVIGGCDVAVDEQANREYYRGSSGLEQYYDDILSGQPGFYKGERGPDGTPIPGGVVEQVAPVDGQDIVVSIDIELQHYMEERLAEGVKALGCPGGNSVVMDGATGEIYAAASLPLYNPGDRTVVAEGATKLKGVTDLLEPGSIFKSVSAMAILETQTMTPDTALFCPASIEADGYTITDAHERGDATFTLREIMDQSSNIGISLASEQMGFDKLYDHIVKYNLHEKTGIDYPGEGEVGTDILGYMTPLDELSRVGAYNVSFGQGISVTPLQMTRFYGALTNNGVECTPHFLISKPQTGETPEYATEEVIENKAAIPLMTDMLKTVVTNGTGKQAAIEGFDVAGKTSTAEIYDPENGGYREGVYNLAFTGFLADSSSQLVCFVGANEVLGDGVVTPIFRDIMATAIDRFKITL